MATCDDPRPQAWVEVDVVRLEYNAKLVRKIVGRNVQIMAAVKANGYGVGAHTAATAFLRAGVNRLGVATVQEAIELRTRLSDKTIPIHLLGGFVPGDMPLIRSHCLVPNLVLAHYTTEQLNDLFAAPPVPPTVSDLVSHTSAPTDSVVSAPTAKAKCTVHVKVDTGMGRTSVPYEQAPDFFTKLDCISDRVHVEGMFMHFPSIDEEEEEEEETKGGVRHSKFQLARFLELARSRRASDKEGQMLMCHAANSAALLCGFKESFLHMVRPGLMLYGYFPSPTTEKRYNRTSLHGPLQPSVTVKARITCIRHAARGTSIGYGGSYVLPTDQVLATVAIGYADGYYREFSNKAVMLIHDDTEDTKYSNKIACPVRGRVSMDQTVIDITAAMPCSSCPSRRRVDVGDEVIVYSNCRTDPNSIEHLSSLIGVIPYELLCRLGTRLPRIVV